jgi:hypothetical protein
MSILLFFLSIPIIYYKFFLKFMYIFTLPKLISKNSEDRYQSAAGLKYDLEECA